MTKQFWSQTADMCELDMSYLVIQSYFISNMVKYIVINASMYVFI